MQGNTGTKTGDLLKIKYLNIGHLFAGILFIVLGGIAGVALYSGGFEFTNIGYYIPIVFVGIGIGLTVTWKRFLTILDRQNRSVVQERNPLIGDNEVENLDMDAVESVNYRKEYTRSRSSRRSRSKLKVRKYAEIEFENGYLLTIHKTSGRRGFSSFFFSNKTYEYAKQAANYMDVEFRDNSDAIKKGMKKAGEAVSNMLN